MEMDTDSSTNENSKKINGRRRLTWFDWIQLIVTVLIPIIIAIYTVVDSKSNESIAEANRRKDVEITEANRRKNLEIAELNLRSEFEIAEANRLNEIRLGEQSREKDRALSIDQQEENILVEYQTFLSKLLLEHGNYLEKSSEAKAVAQLMTLTAFEQINIKRKRILLRSLHHANLINFLKTGKLFDTSVVNLDQADLSHIQFGLALNQTGQLPMYRYISWNYLYLPRTILTYASFRYTILDHTTFTQSIMDFVDMSFAAHTNHQSPTNFVNVSMIKANLSNVRFRLTNFSLTNLILSQMDNFECIECHFSHSILTEVNLNYSRFPHTLHLSKNRLQFNSANFSHSHMYFALFRSINFSRSDWSHVQASQIGIYNSIFTNAIMRKSLLSKSIIQDSTFEFMDFYETDFSYARFSNVTFINSNMYLVNMHFVICEQCFFINVNFVDTIWTYVSLTHSKFRDCSIDINELLENSIDISESKLINGTKEYNLGELNRYHWIVYNIRVKTGNRIPIETYMNVYLTIFGQMNQTKETELKSNEYQLNRFQPEHIDNFTYLFDNLGQITSIRIRYYENSHRTSWLLDWIEIDIPSRDEYYTFNCSCWIKQNERTNEYQIELKPSNITKKNISVTYEVTVYTGNHHGLCEDCEVSLKIYGEYRDSNWHKLSPRTTNSKPFQHPQKDIFYINSLPLGKLKDIDVSVTTGYAKSLFLVRIEIRDMRIKNSYFDFEFQKIIYHTHSNFEEKAPPTDIALTQYYTMDDFKFFKIFVITSNSRGSGTNANVYIIIFDSFKNTDKIPLQRSRTHQNPFEKGFQDEFHVEIAELDSPTKIKIGHDNSGIGSDWSLDRIEIERPGLNQKWIFPYGKELTLNAENKIEIELYPKTTEN